MAEYKSLPPEVLARTLQELGVELSLSEPGYLSGLVQNCRRLYQTPLQDYTPNDLREMITQEIGLDYVVPVAVDRLCWEPWIATEFGFLVDVVMGVNEGFWRSMPELKHRMDYVVDKVRIDVTQTTTLVDRWQMTTTLYLTPRYTPDSVALWRQAIADGWTVERLQSRTQKPVVRTPRAAVYGEPFFAAEVAASIHVALLEPPFEWLTLLPHRLTQRDVRFGRLIDARVIDVPTFVKPADDKCFDARVYTSGAELPGDDQLDGDIPVLMAEPVRWLSEFRCFVLDGVVQAISVYMRSGELAQSEDGDWPATAEELVEAKAFAEKVAAEVILPPAVVVDVGVIDGRGWAVVEANPAWASGIYGCDPSGVLRVLYRACVPEAELTTADVRWIVDRSATGR